MMVRRKDDTNLLKMIRKMIRVKKFIISKDLTSFHRQNRIAIVIKRSMIA